MLVLLLVIFSLCLNFSQQDSLYDLALQQGLNVTEAEDVRDYGKHGIKRQTTFKTKSGIPQTKICGINGKTLSRLRRQNRAEDERPQGSLDWPWMALFLYKDGAIPFCGGALLNSRYVLTASHCFQNEPVKNKESFFVRLGEYDIEEGGETEVQNFEVEELIRHEDYDAGNQQNDIAIVKLNQTVEYTQFVRPICLPGANEPRPEEDTIVAGWGKTSDKGQSSHLLLYVDVPIWDHNECVDAFTQPVHDTNICAAPQQGGKDSCQGDSGGPLMYQAKSKRWESVGVVSWGLKCAEALSPGVYTSVPKYLKWIGERISNAPP